MEDSRKTPSPWDTAPGPSAYQGRSVTIMGLGLFGGGVAAARYFATRGARVTVTDIKTADELAPSVAALADLSITYRLGGHVDADFTGADIVCVSPAVKRDSPYLALAERADAEITSEMNLFASACQAPVVGITGSNGKSTTTTLVCETLKAHQAARIGGNIGKSLLGELDAIRPDETIVLELSSFQLEDLGRIRWSPRAAIVTCISENHVDHHGSMAAYIDAKKNILRYQKSDGLAVLNADDAEVRSWRADAPGRVVWYSMAGPVDEGAYAAGQDLVFRLDGREERVSLAGRNPLLGRHNVANILAAATAARVYGVPVETIAATVGAFKPLAHRLEPVGRLGGVLFVNDSKATTPVAAQAGIDSFTEPVVLIAGGYDKQANPAPMIEAIRRRARAVVLVGQTAGQLAAAIGPGGPAVEQAETFEQAVRRAAALAQPGDVVLLSPGHASWGMFTHYEFRGAAFRDVGLALGMTPL